MKNFVWIILAFLLSSCFKEDEQISPHTPGDVETAMIALTKNYADNVFFSLESGDAVLTSGKLQWDLGFESGEAGWRVYLNTTRFMQAAPTGSSNFEDVKDTIGLSWSFDVSSGHPDSTAIGMWFQTPGGDTVSKQEVYVLDMGFDANGNVQGFRKFQILGWNKNSFTIRYAKLDGNEDNTQEILKISNSDIVCYSLRNHSIAMNARPLVNSWDIWFTQYTTMLFTNDGTPYPYLVTGVLSNRMAGVGVARDKLVPFNEIDYEYALGLSYSSKADVIGYDWKYYDFNAGSYTVDPGISYLIRGVEGAIFKLRFIGFYNATGEKGYPTIEFQRL